MTRLALALLALMIASCSPSDQVDESTRQDRDIFVGHLIRLNEEPVESRLKLRFYSTDGDDVADRYFLVSDCFEAGYFDQRHGAFLSGHSPIGTDTEKSPAHLVQQAAENHKTRRCPDDSANFSRFMDLMYVGASLEIDGEHARLTSKNGLSADLVREPMPLILD